MLKAITSLKPAVAAGLDTRIAEMLQASPIPFHLFFFFLHQYFDVLFSKGKLHSEWTKAVIVLIS